MKISAAVVPWLRWELNNNNNKYNKVATTNPYIVNYGGQDWTAQKRLPVDD